MRYTLDRVWIFLKIVGRYYDDLPDSFRIMPDLAWELAGILAERD